MNHFFPDFVDKHVGQVCIILGNGPSVLDYDLRDSFFTDNVTIGSNAIGKVFIPTYYFIGDLVAFDKFGTLLLNGISVPIVGKYLAYSSAFTRNKKASKAVVANYSFGDRVGIPKKGRIFHGRTSGVVMLHLAYQMGFKYIFMLGIDGYSVPGMSHFYSGSAGRSSSDRVVSDNLTLCLDQLKAEGRYLFNLSYRSVFTQVPIWHDVTSIKKITESS